MIINAQELTDLIEVVREAVDKSSIGPIVIKDDLNINKNKGYNTIALSTFQGILGIVVGKSLDAKITKKED